MKARPAWPGRFAIDILRSFNLERITRENACSDSQASAPSTPRRDRARQPRRPGLHLDHGRDLPHRVRHLSPRRLRRSARTCDPDAGRARRCRGGRPDRLVRALRARRADGGVFADVLLPPDSRHDETFTRLPVGAPLFTGPDDPALRPVVGTLFLLFLIGAGLQVWRLRAGRKPVVAPPLTQA